MLPATAPLQFPTTFATGPLHLLRGTEVCRSIGLRSPWTQTEDLIVVSYRIIAEQCTACGACEFECPNQAISMSGNVYSIDPTKCTECEGHYDTPQCAKVCPVDNTCVPA